MKRKRIAPPSTEAEWKVYKLAFFRYPILPWDRHGEPAEDFGVPDLTEERVAELVTLAGRCPRCRPRLQHVAGRARPRLGAGRP
jgi:hypothetical protein